MEKLEFLAEEIIKVMDQHALMESKEGKIQVQLIITNFRFLVVQKNILDEKKVICSLKLEEIKKVEQYESETICWLEGENILKFESKSIGNYLEQLIGIKKM